MVYDVRWRVGMKAHWKVLAKTKPTRSSAEWRPTNSAASSAITEEGIKSFKGSLKDGWPQGW
jgi:hypothetical protein